MCRTTLHYRTVWTSWVVLKTNGSPWSPPWHGKVDFFILDTCLSMQAILFTLFHPELCCPTQCLTKRVLISWLKPSTNVCLNCCSQTVHSRISWWFHYHYVDYNLELSCKIIIKWLPWFCTHVLTVVMLITGVNLSSIQSFQLRYSKTSLSFHGVAEFLALGFMSPQTSSKWTLHMCSSPASSDLDWYLMLMCLQIISSTRDLGVNCKMVSCQSSMLIKQMFYVFNIFLISSLFDLLLSSSFRLSSYFAHLAFTL